MAARPFDAEMSILRLVDDDERMDVFVADFLSHKNRDRSLSTSAFEHNCTFICLYKTYVHK